jgi:hypothetical protein
MSERASERVKDIDKDREGGREIEEHRDTSEEASGLRPQASVESSRAVVERYRDSRKKRQSHMVRRNL